MTLPEGWYPHEKDAVEKIIESWSIIHPENRGKHVAGIVPHAGWYYSGKAAWNLVNRIPENTETVIISGGHLSESSTPKCWKFKEFEIPGGHLEKDEELFMEICQEMEADYTADNTIEVLLPLIAYKLQDVKVLAMRLPPHESSYEWGWKAGEASGKFGKKTFFIGSTDLTHYGDAYGNTLYSREKDPLSESHKKEQHLFTLLNEGRIQEALEFDERWKTSCSLGAALGAVGFADFYKKLPGEVLSITSSADITGDRDSFVNYGTLLF